MKKFIGAALIIVALLVVTSDNNKASDMGMHSPMESMVDHDAGPVRSLLTAPLRLFAGDDGVFTGKGRDRRHERRVNRRERRQERRSNRRNSRIFQR